MAKNVLPKHWNGSEFEELHIVTKASNVFTNDNKSVQQKIDDFTSHKAENVAYGQSVTRDISISGVQVIALPFKAKSIIIFAFEQDTKSESTGFWDENNLQRTRIRRGYDDVYRGVWGAVRIYSSPGNHATGMIQNVTDGGFEINWSKTGSPAGEVIMYILAFSHGGV